MASIAKRHIGKPLEDIVIETCQYLSVHKASTTNPKKGSTKQNAESKDPEMEQGRRDASSMFVF